MRSILTVLAVLVLLVGCDGGPIDAPTPPDGHRWDKRFLCIGGFVYVKYSHSIAPVFDKADRLPMRCPK